MALLDTVAFTDVPASTTVELPHNISINGTPVLPDIVMRDNMSFEVVAVTASTITLHNAHLNLVRSCNVLLQRVHSIPRDLGGSGASLSPQPFIVGGSAACECVTPGS